MRRALLRSFVVALLGLFCAQVAWPAESVPATPERYTATSQVAPRPAVAPPCPNDTAGEQEGHKLQPVAPAARGALGALASRANPLSSAQRRAMRRGPTAPIFMRNCSYLI